MYEDQVRDKFGNMHGVSQLVPLGYLVKVALLWQKTSLKITHNFTVSVYADENDISVYSHTYVIQNVNSSQNMYLFPKFTSNSKYQDPVSVQMFENDENIEAHYMDVHMKHNPESLSKVSFTERDQTIYGDDETESGTSHSRYLNKHFSVMSFNIWNMNSLIPKNGYTKRMWRLKEVILKASPDIIGIQEVRYEAIKGEELGPSQMDTLAAWFPEFQFVFRPAQMQPNTLQDGRTEEGVAIMSKYPIIAHNTTMLFINRSNSADLHQRVLLHAQIYIPNLGKVHVFVTHLSLSHEAREQSVVQICNIMKQQQAPVILLGDLNAEPHERAVRYLTGDAVLPGGDRCQLQDTWRDTNPKDQKGYTFNTLEGVLSKRIDYIMFHDSTFCTQANQVQVLDDGERRTSAASDHLPILASFFIQCPMPQS